MSEIKWVVAMHRHNQVFIVIGEAQIRQLAGLVPFAWPDKNGAPRVGFANDSYCLGINRVQHRGGRGILRFVEQLEGDSVGRLRIVGGNLAPDRVKLVGEAGRIAGELVEVMDVHDDVEAVLERVGDQKVGFAIDFVRKFEIRRRPGVMVPGDGETHVVETLGLDVHKILLRIARTPILSPRRLKVIAEVCAPQEFFRRAMGSGVLTRKASHFAGFDGVGLAKDQGGSRQEGEEESEFCGRAHGRGFIRYRRELSNRSSAHPTVP